jgi:hypothetical protein
MKVEDLEIGSFYINDIGQLVELVEITSDFYHFINKINNLDYYHSKNWVLKTYKPIKKTKLINILYK